jgi:hypothetical protein
MVDLQGARWFVTDFGLEAVNPDDETYRIPRSRLLEIDAEGFVPLYVCPMRVSTQIGVDINAFLDAWRKAIEVHGRLLPRVDRRILSDSLHQARWNTERLKRERRNEANHVWADLPPPADAPSYPSAEAPSPPSMEGPDPHPQLKQANPGNGLPARWCKTLDVKIVI